MIYYIIIVVLTALLSSIATVHAPNIKARYRRFKSTKNQKLERMIAIEVEKQLKKIIDND